MEVVSDGAKDTQPIKLGLIIPLGQAVHPTAFETLIDALAECIEIVFTGPPGSCLYKATSSRGQQPIARTVLGRDTIAHGAEWLLWLDDDMVIPRGTVTRLMQHAKSGKKCITAHYYSRSHSDIYGNGTYPSNVFLPRPEGGHKAIDPNIREGLMQVSACGFGCVLMHKDVFEAVEKKAKEHNCPPFSTYEHCTEDVYWCNWAKEAGQEIWYDPSIRCGHLKMISVCDETVPLIEPKVVEAREPDPQPV